MNKTQQKRIDAIRAAIADLEAGLSGKPFSWGDAERRQKQRILASLDFIVASETKLRRGGHELKPGVKPIGFAYFGSPIRKTAKLYLLGAQTTVTPRYYELLETGKALRMYQAEREEYAFDRAYFEIRRVGEIEKALRETTDTLARIIAALVNEGGIDFTLLHDARAQLTQNAALLEGEAKK